MEIIDKIKVANELADLKVWQYARITELLQKQFANDQERINTCCEILELSTDKPAHIWREQYKLEFTLSIFEKVRALMDKPFNLHPLSLFKFTSLTPEDTRERQLQVDSASIWKRYDLRNNLKIDSNREYHVEKTGAQTFEQVIQSEILVKELVSIDAEITVRNYKRLPRLLAFVCKLEGEQFHYFDQNDLQYKFNYVLIDYREKVFMHLDIETAWRVYLAFFLTGQKQSSDTTTSGKQSEKELRSNPETGRSISTGGE